MPKQNADPLARCKRASQHYPGAPISRRQLRDVETGIKPAQRALASKHRAALVKYAKTGDRTNVPAKANELLRAVNALYPKSWSRKSAAIMGDAIHTREPRAKKSKEVSDA